jgi:hypothetical protein
MFDIFGNDYLVNVKSGYIYCLFIFSITNKKENGYILIT